MKKFTSMILALVMALALAVPAFAEEIEPADGGKKEQEVTANYKAPASEDKGAVYYFTVEWTQNDTHDLAYEGKNATYTWNGSSMKYVEKINNTDESKIGWTGETGYKVIVTNQSNAQVTVKTSASNDYNLDLTKPANEETTLNTAAVTGENKTAISYTDITSVGTKQPADFTYTYKAITSADAPTASDGANSVTVGKITVTVSK